MNHLALMTGVDLPVVELQLQLHQPRIKEISYLGEKEFFAGLGCLCVDKNLIQQDKTLLEKSTNFQIFMAIMKEPQENQKKQQALAALNLFFPQCKLFLTPRSLVLMEGEQSHVIDESNFEVIQQLLRTVCCLDRNQEGLPEYNPKGKKAQEIAEKLMKGRQRIAEQKAKEDGHGGSMFAQYISIITVGIASMSLNDTLELTVYQIYDLMERYSKYVNWDIDIRSRLAGAKADSPPESWMENIH